MIGHEGKGRHLTPTRLVLLLLLLVLLMHLMHRMPQPLAWSGAEGPFPVGPHDAPVGEPKRLPHKAVVALDPSENPGRVFLDHFLDL